MKKHLQSGGTGIKHCFGVSNTMMGCDSTIANGAKMAVGPIYSAKMAADAIYVAGGGGGGGGGSSRSSSRSSSSSRTSSSSRKQQ